MNQPFHLSGEAEPYRVGAFDSCQEAQAACRRVVDEYLGSRALEGTDPATLLDWWREAGPEPWIDPRGGDCRFRAADYARERCSALGDRPPPASDARGPTTPV